MKQAKKFKVGNKNMTVRELVDHPDNVFDIKDSQMRARLNAGDRTFKRLLRPVRQSVEGRMMADMERVTLGKEKVEEIPAWAPSVPEGVRTANGLVSSYPKPVTRHISDGSTAEYYELPEAVRELQDLISYKDMNAQVGEIFRACYRYGEAGHSEKLRDAKKMRFYAQAEIDRLEQYGDA